MSSNSSAEDSDNSEGDSDCERDHNGTTLSDDNDTNRKQKIMDHLGELSRSLSPCVRFINDVLQCQYPANSYFLHTFIYLPTSCSSFCVDAHQQSFVSYSGVTFLSLSPFTHAESVVDTIKHQHLLQCKAFFSSIV